MEYATFCQGTGSNIGDEDSPSLRKSRAMMSWLRHRFTIFALVVLLFCGLIFVTIYTEYINTVQIHSDLREAAEVYFAPFEYESYQTLAEICGLVLLTHAEFGGMDTDSEQLEAGLRALGNIGEVMTLVMTGGSINDSSVRALEGLSYVASISIVDADISDAALIAFRDTEISYSVSIIDCPINGTGLVNFRNPNNKISNLSLIGTAITDENLAILNLFDNLSSLNLARNALDGSGLGFVTKIKSLSMLCLSSTKIQDDNLQFLAKSPSIKFLNLSNTSITDKGLKHLHSLKTLRYLRLEYCADVHMLEFGNMPNLQVLTLDASGLADDAIVTWKNLDSLSVVTVLGCDISPKGLRHLVSMPNIEFILVDKKIAKAAHKKYPQNLAIKIRGVQMDKIDSDYIDGCSFNSFGQRIYDYSNSY